MKFLPAGATLTFGFHFARLVLTQRILDDTSARMMPTTLLSMGTLGTVRPNQVAAGVDESQASIVVAYLVTLGGCH